MQLAQRAEDRGGMAMRARADDVEGLRQRGANGSGALQDGAKRLDFGWGPVGEIGDLRTLPSSRKLSRNRIAGGELRLGTTATYM